MRDILQPLLTASVFVFTVSSMLSVGFAYTVRQVLAPLRFPTAVIRALVANFVLVPILAIAIVRLVPLSSDVQIGLVLLGCAAGAPFLIKLTQAAEGDVGLSATLLVLLVPFTVVFMALVVPWLVPATNVSAAPIAVQLTATLLVPFAIGLVVRAMVPRWAQRLQPIMGKTSTIALLVLFATTIVLHARGFLALGFTAVVAALMLIFGAFAIGYLLARPGQSRRTVLALGTAQRNIAASTIVATQDIERANTLVMVVLTAIVSILVLFPLARWLRGRATRGVAPAPPTGRDLAGVHV